MRQTQVVLQGWHQVFFFAEYNRLYIFFSHINTKFIDLRLLKGNGSDARVRLYRVYGRCPVLSELEDVSWQHFCSSGVFLLETPETIFIWVGRAANTVEKLHGTKVF